MGWYELFWLFVVGLAFLAGLRVRRSRARPDRRGPLVDDDVIRAIERDGRVVTDEDEPLDLDEIEAEERRFWEEEWDEAEEW